MFNTGCFFTGAQALKGCSSIIPAPCFVNRCPGPNNQSFVTIYCGCEHWKYFWQTMQLACQPSSRRRRWRTAGRPRQTACRPSTPARPSRTRGAGARRRRGTPRGGPTGSSARPAGPPARPSGGTRLRRDRAPPVDAVGLAGQLDRHALRLFLVPAQRRPSCRRPRCRGRSCGRCRSGRPARGPCRRSSSWQ